MPKEFSTRDSPLLFVVFIFSYLVQDTFLNLAQDEGGQDEYYAILLDQYLSVFCHKAAELPLVYSLNLISVV